MCKDGEGDIVAAFSFIVGNDPTYDVIYDGRWLNDAPYGVVHRMVSSGKVSRIGEYCMQWCYEQCGNIRVDTHHENIVMQNLLIRLGYTRCGIILLADGRERIAFQK